MPKTSKPTIRLTDEETAWIEKGIKNAKFSSISHAIRYCIHQEMNRIQIASDLLEIMGELVSEGKYSSRDAFANEAIRRLLKEYGRIP